MMRTSRRLGLAALTAIFALGCTGDDDDDDGLPIHETFGAGAFSLGEACDGGPGGVEDDLFAFEPGSTGTLTVALTWDSVAGSILQASLTDITDDLFVPIAGGTSSSGLVELSGTVAADTRILLAIECLAGAIEFDGAGTVP